MAGEDKAEERKEARGKEEEKKKKVKRGKKAHKNKPTSKKYKHYKIEGDKVVRSKFCPRCGPGVFLAKMSGRLYCGKCAYTSFDKEEIERAK